MKYLLCFVTGFITCLLFGCGYGVFSQLVHPFGKITYNGNGVVFATDGENHQYEINQQGVDLPYGNYKIKLKNGRTVSVLKNNRGNVEIEEDSDAVFVYGDANTIWATLERK